MASRKSIHMFISKCFMAVKKCINILIHLRVSGASLLTCSYIGELRDGRKSKCENKPFIVPVLILVLRRNLI